MLKTFKKLSEEKQDKILESAADIFAEKGYYQSSVADICAEAGISNGALYKYFRNKEALFIAVLGKGISLVRKLYTEYGVTTHSVYDTFKNIFLGLEPMVREYSSYVSIYLDLATVSMNHFAEYISGDLENVGRDFLHDLISNGIERGEISENISIQTAVYSIDNLIILYVYSLVSEHYKKRLLNFMKRRDEITQQDIIDFMMESVLMILKI